MSGFVAMRHVLEQSNAKHSARLVLMALAWHADDGGFSYPSVETIAGEAQLSETTVHDALRQLVAIGELEILPNQGRKGTNLYRVVLPGSDQMPLLDEGADFAPVQNFAPKPSLPESYEVTGATVPTGNNGSGAESAGGAKHAPAPAEVARIRTMHERKRMCVEAAALWVARRQHHRIERFTDRRAIAILRDQVAAAVNAGAKWPDIEKALLSHAGEVRASVYYVSEWIDENRHQRQLREIESRKNRERREADAARDAMADASRAELRAKYPGKTMREILELEGVPDPRRSAALDPRGPIASAAGWIPHGAMRAREAAS